MDQFNLTDSYDYERWPGDLLNWWRELRSRIPDNVTAEGLMDYDVLDEFTSGDFNYMDPGAEHIMAAGGHQLSDWEAKMLRAANVLRLYYTPSVVVVGIFGSLLAMPLLARVGRVTRSSHVPYLIGLSVCTLLYLVGLSLTWLGSVGVNVYGIPGTCQFMAFVSQSSHFLYTWIMVALVADRFAVQLVTLGTCPGWLALIVSPTRAKILILILAAVALATFFNLSMMEGTVHFGAVKICVVIVEYLRTSLVLDKIDAILNFFVPFLVLVLVDIALILNHCRLKLRRVPLEILGDAYVTGNPLRPSPSCSTTTERSTPEIQHHMVPAQTTRGRIMPSISSIIATVATSGVYVTLSLPTTIQRTVSTFADDHLLFSMTARGILYQHTFANLFYTAFLCNIALTFLIDADVRRETGIVLRNTWRACFRCCPKRKCAKEGVDLENGSDTDCPDSDVRRGAKTTIRNMWRGCFRSSSSNRKGVNE